MDGGGLFVQLSLGNTDDTQEFEVKQVIEFDYIVYLNIEQVNF